ncbi:uncharacterized protein CEXT_313651 [Caerostris extrusa]|uniref:Uncharacterized protein n=1 Tax=Caerostris extrusa TaxID=172846 RepID=A0AAV4N1P7_CAEEX|nr:uncharacterized protein CEXT_313651 [Caerostris extrusa]
MRGADLARLQDSISKIIAHFAQPHPTFIYAAYIALLKDNEFDPNTVIQKLLEGDKDARTLGVTPRIQPTIPSPPPQQLHQQLPSRHPIIPIGHPPSITASAATPPTTTRCPTTRAAFPSPRPARPPTRPSRRPGRPSTAPSTPTSRRRPTPPPRRRCRRRARRTSRRRPTDSGTDTSGDSRGSADLKDESDKEGGGRGETSTPRSVVVSPVNSIVAHRRSRSNRPYQIYSLSFPDRRETAANA